MINYSKSTNTTPSSAGYDRLYIEPFSIRENQIAVLLVVLATLYNAILAFLVARGINMGFSGVAAVEALLTILTVSICLKTGLSRYDIFPIGLLWFVIVCSVAVSISHDRLYIGSIRNIALISAFSMLGTRMSVDYVRKAFAITSAIALIVLIWEIASVSSYAWFFAPARYYEATRGLGVSEFDTTGLSNGTVAYEGRFSLGIFSGARTSSIFLEQVSINAYSIVCIAFLNGLWGVLMKKEKALQILLIFLIVASNNARMGALMCIVMPIGYFIFPFLSRILIPIVPLMIISVIFAFGSILANAVGDDLTGRLGVTYRLLSQFNLSDVFLGNPDKVNNAFDSGYAFVGFSLGLTGGIAYLSYLTLFPGFTTPAQRRLCWSVAIYILVWLTVGGTATFSVKTAALLWVLVGSMASLLQPRPTATNNRPRVGQMVR